MTKENLRSLEPWLNIGIKLRKGLKLWTGLKKTWEDWNFGWMLDYNWISWKWVLDRISIIIIGLKLRIGEKLRNWKKVDTGWNSDS